MIAGGALVLSEYDRTLDMTTRKLVEVQRLYGVEREKVRLDDELGEIKASIARAETRIGEIRLQILAITDIARTNAQRELSGVEPRLAELNERALAIQDRLSRTDVRSPSRER